MRTTVTLDDDLAVLLEKVRGERGQTFKEALNEALRKGLIESSAPAQIQPGDRYEFDTVDMGHPLMENMDNLHEVLTVGESESHR